MMTPEDIMRDTVEGQVYTDIFEKFRWQMQRVLADYGVKPEDEQYDYLMDFYLFLRDNKKGPFSSYLTIRAERGDASRAQWLRTAFRHYMNRKFVENMSPLDENTDLEDDDQSVFALRDIRMAVDVLDRVNKTFPAPERVIFFYELHSVSYDEDYPTEKIKKLLSCTEGNLRVMKHRVKNKVRAIVKQMEEAV